MKPLCTHVDNVSLHPSCRDITEAYRDWSPNTFNLSQPLAERGHHEFEIGLRLELETIGVLSHTERRNPCVSAVSHVRVRPHVDVGLIARKMAFCQATRSRVSVVA